MKRFTIAQLDAFHAICRLGTFSAAAEVLHLTQPSVSQRIAELEAALGIRIFDRDGKKISLTREGVLLERYVGASLALLDEIHHVFSPEHDHLGAIRIGTIDTLAYTCLANVAQALEHEYPAVDVDFMISTNQLLLDALDRHEIDIAFLLQPDVRANHWGKEIGKIDVAWLSRRGTLDDHAPLTPQALEATKVIARHQPSMLNGVIRNWFASAKVPTPKLTLCSSIGVISKFVERGLAASVLPVCILDEQIKNGEVIRHEAVPPLMAMGIHAIALQENQAYFDRLVVPVVQAELIRARIFVASGPGAKGAPASSHTTI